MADSKLVVSDLDFDTIKSNLKNYLRDQDEFSGFDFEGTNLAVLINLLAYNTHYNSYYLNMMMNENFLDSSQLRSTTVSKAKMLGYTPRSITSSKATILISGFSSSAPPYIEIPQFTKFSGAVDDSTYIFCTDKTYTLTKKDNSNYQGTINLVQGKPVSFTFVVNKNDTEQRFILPNVNIDTSTLKVSVRENTASNKIEYYTYAENFVNVNETSQIFFLDEVIDGRFRIYFGQNGIGKELTDGNIISVTGLISDGGETNGIFNFNLIDDVNNLESYQIITTRSASGGAQREDVESIKFGATKHFASQNRVVTTEDYKIMLEKNLPNVLSVDIWGGEDNSPPIYGKVFVALQPRNSNIISDSMRENAINLMSSKKLVSIIPEIVNPDYIYIRTMVDVKYDSRRAGFTADALSGAIKNKITTYFNVNLKRFYTKFRYSVLSRELQNLDPSVNSINLKIDLKKEISPVKGQYNDINVAFNNKLYHPFEAHEGTVFSTYFSYYDSAGDLWSNCRLEDYNETIRVIRLFGGVKIVVDSDVGTVNYSTGLIRLVEFKPENYNSDFVSVYCLPYSGDVLSGKGQIININPQDISVIVVDEVEDNTQLSGLNDQIPTGGGYLANL